MNLKMKLRVQNGVFNKSLLKIFMVLLFAISIMFLSNYYIYRSSMNEMFKQAEINNELVVNGVIQSFEENFKEINDIIYTIDTLPYNIHDSEGHNNVNMNNAYLLMKNVNQLISQDFIADFVVFFKDSDLALTLSGTESFQSIFSNKYKSDKYASEYWKNFAVTSHPMKIIPEDYYQDTRNSGKTVRKLLAIVASNQMSSTVKNMVVFVDLPKLYKKVNEQSMMKGSSLIILDKDKNVIINTDDNYNMEGLEGIIVDSDKETTVQKGKYNYHVIKSEYNSFTYINKVPHSYEGSISIIKYNRLILFLTTIAGVAISLILSIYLYSPIKKILWLVGMKEEDKNQNNYKYIYNHIEKMQMENKLISNKMDNVKEEVMRSIFFKMIDDITFYKQMKDQIDTYFKAIFFNKQFLMVALEFTINDQPDNGNSNTAPIAPDEIRKIIKDSLEDIGQGKLSVVVFYIEKMRLVALVGINESIKRDQLVRDIDEMKNQLQNTVFNEYTITAVVGKFYDEAQNCKEAFDEIKMCFEYRSINNMKTLIDLEKNEYSYDVYMPLDFDEKLSNYILSGNVDESMKLIKQIVETNIQNNISFIKFQYILNNIFHTMVNIMVHLNVNQKEIEIAEKEFRRKMKTFVITKNYTDFFYSLVKLTTDKIRGEDSGKLNKDFVLQYIQLHFSENLYLDKMAEVFNTTPKYFSNFFKKAFGVNFIEYLNKARISHAKELLKGSEIPVNEIGERIGYLNPSTFSSTFKKYCGITPSEYRKKYNTK